MQTGKGIKRVGDALVFLHNWILFPSYISMMQQRAKKLRPQGFQGKGDKEVKAEYMRTLSHIQAVKRWQQKYDEIYDKFFKIID